MQSTATSSAPPTTAPSGIASARAGGSMRRVGGMPRPSKTGLSEAERVRLLKRETEACGPNHLLIRHKAVMEAIKTGDPRLLAGSLDDLAAACVV